MTMATICSRQQGDSAEIERLLDAAFGMARRNKISYSFRIDLEPIWSLCLTARDADKLVGTISAWPVAVGRSPNAAILLGPIAVSAYAQGTGLGSKLIDECLDRARGQGYDLVLLVGDLPYYGRFGFVPAATYDIKIPGENAERVLALPLRPGSVAAGDVRHWRSVRLGQRAA